mgnify:CR=1 FL=1
MHLSLRKPFTKTYGKDGYPLVLVFSPAGPICHGINLLLNQGRLQVVLGAHVIKHTSAVALNNKIKLGLTAYFCKNAKYRGSLVYRITQGFEIHSLKIA